MEFVIKNGGMPTKHSTIEKLILVFVFLSRIMLGGILFGIILSLMSLNGIFMGVIFTLSILLYIISSILLIWISGIELLEKIEESFVILIIHGLLFPVYIIYKLLEMRFYFINDYSPILGWIFGLSFIIANIYILCGKKYPKEHYWTKFKWGLLINLPIVTILSLFMIFFIFDA